MTIAEQIRTRRTELEMTQLELAFLVGCSQGRLSEWERGATQPTLANLERLAAVLGSFTIGE